MAFRFCLEKLRWRMGATGGRQAPAPPAASIAMYVAPRPADLVARRGQGRLHRPAGADGGPWARTTQVLQPAGCRDSQKRGGADDGVALAQALPATTEPGELPERQAQRDRTHGARAQATALGRACVFVIVSQCHHHLLQVRLGEHPCVNIAGSSPRHAPATSPASRTRLAVQVLPSTLGCNSSVTGLLELLLAGRVRGS